MAKKLIKVSDMLQLMEEDDNVEVEFLGYGFHWANSCRDGISTVKECKERLLFDCLNAKVIRVMSSESVVRIVAEMMY